MCVSGEAFSQLCINARTMYLKCNKTLHKLHRYIINLLFLGRISAFVLKRNLPNTIIGLKMFVPCRQPESQISHRTVFKRIRSTHTCYTHSSSSSAISSLDLIIPRSKSCLIRFPCRDLPQKYMPRRPRGVTTNPEALRLFVTDYVDMGLAKTIPYDALPFPLRYCSALLTKLPYAQNPDLQCGALKCMDQVHCGMLV